MIAYIAGSLTHKAPTQVIIDVEGLGYEVQISAQTYTHIKNYTEGKLFTHLHITQDAHTLYGFATPEEKKWFLHLVAVNGVGPRMGIAILSSLAPEELTYAIQHRNVATLSTVKGVGPKVAQRIILELSARVGASSAKASEIASEAMHPESVSGQALTALVRLGIAKGQAEKAIGQVLKGHTGALSVETLIKLALKN